MRFWGWLFASISRQESAKKPHLEIFLNLASKHWKYCSSPTLSCSKKFHIYNFLSFQDGNNCTFQYLVRSTYFWFRYQENKNIFLGLRSQSENEILLEDFCLNQKVEIPIQILATFFFWDHKSSWLSFLGLSKTSNDDYDGSFSSGWQNSGLWDINEFDLIYILSLIQHLLQRTLQSQSSMLVEMITQS